jgi:hypothetical protein
MPSRMIHRRWLGVPHSLALIMALVSQLALGSMVLPDQTPPVSWAAADAVSVLCGPHQHDRAPPAHHHESPVLCARSVALALPLVLLASDVAVPLPRPVTTHRVVILASARGPPALVVRVLV